MTEERRAEPSDDSPSVPMLGLDALLFASLQDCPDAVLFRDDRRSATGRAFAGRVQAIAAQLRQCGLQPGERVYLAMGATADCLAALFAALRAGLEPALAACGLGPVEVAAQARAAGAVALIGPTHYGPLALGETYLSAAAVSDMIRLVATLGPDVVDGAADFSPAALSATPAQSPAFGPETPSIVTFETAAATPVVHRQAALFAAALALVDEAQVNPSKPLLTTIVPATLAGLVGGPFAALIGASSLALHGPFDSEAFLVACDREPGLHVLAPAAMGATLQETAHWGDGSLILLSRFPSSTAFSPPPPLPGDRLMVDLYAIGEQTVIAKRRAAGVAQAPRELFDGSLPGPLGVALNRARSRAEAPAADAR